MTNKALVRSWFEIWENGDFHNLPLTTDFRHTSPYGTIEGRSAYMTLIKANRNKFLGHRFSIHDELFDAERACIRYTTRRSDFKLEVTEWFYLRHKKIREIISHYNIESEISAANQLQIPPNTY